MKQKIGLESLRGIIATGYVFIAVIIGVMLYTWGNEWRELAVLESENRQIDNLRQEIHSIYVHIAILSLHGETVIDWDDAAMMEYHAERMVADSILLRLGRVYPNVRIDSVRNLLATKEWQLRSIRNVLNEQTAINDRIANQISVIARRSATEEPQKSKRRSGFLGIFGKKMEGKPTTTTTMLYTLDRDFIRKYREQSENLVRYTDSLATRNAQLNHQLQVLISQLDAKVHKDLRQREAYIESTSVDTFRKLSILTAIAATLLIICYIVVHRNVKRIKQYKRETANLIRQLEQSLQQNEVLIDSRKKAVYTITHELRTPLTAITGYAGLMQKENCTDKFGLYIQSIQQSSDRMRDMLNTLLDFFRLDNGKEQPWLTPCRISAITHTLETEFMPVAMNKGLSLTVKNGNDAVVLTDKERIIQLGNNLLSNAIKFTENGSVTLNTNYGNGILTLVVEDTGTGMNEEEQQRVFGAFERLSNAAAKDGFGLGLAIVHGIVAMLGGKIRLGSRKGEGSRFTVEIPMPKVEELPEQTIQAYIHQKERNLGVIAIDNDEVLLLMMKEMFAQEGIHCDTCSNVAELVEMIRWKEYNLLLTDLNMPDINGFELLELLRSSNVGNSRTIPVVVATASGSCDKEEMLAKGFAGCLFKPFSISELMEVSNKCAIKTTKHDKPDFASLLSYGNETVMLDKLITETEKEMQGVKDTAMQKDLQGLDTLIHHLRSSWEILRADRPLRELYELIHSDGIPDEEMFNRAVTAVLDKGVEIIRLAKEEREKYNG